MVAVVCREQEVVVSASLVGDSLVFNRGSSADSTPLGRDPCLSDVDRQRSWCFALAD